MEEKLENPLGDAPLVEEIERFLTPGGMFNPGEEIAEAERLLRASLTALTGGGCRQLSAEELRGMCADAMRKEGVTRAVMNITPTGVFTSFSYGDEPLRPEPAAEEEG